jgi:hypothetical protein
LGDELLALLDSHIRCVVVAQKPVDVRSHEQNSVFVLQLPDGIRTATGSRGGSGRALVKAYHFISGEGGFKKTAEIDDEETLGRLDLPYQATAMAIFEPDGGQRLVTGVVDESLALTYGRLLG